MKIFERIVVVFATIVFIITLGISNAIYAVSDEPAIFFEDETSDNEIEQMIKELETQINDLNAEIEQLKTEREIQNQNIERLIGDIEVLYEENEMLVAQR